jgi:Tfp pilus assembly protein PilO
MMNAVSLRKIAWWLRHGRRTAGPVGLAGLALLLGAVLFYVATVPSSQARLTELRQATASLHERLQRAAGSFDDFARTPEEQLANFYGAFPAIGATPDLLDKIYRAAARRGLTLQQGEYRTKRDRSSLLTRYQISLPVSGPYLQVREFLADVLRQIPFLALDNVSFQREKIGESVVEARVNFTLYLGEGS